MKVAYIDSSILVRSYLPTDPGHREAVDLLGHPDTAIITSTLTRIEASGALVRAARSVRVDPTAALARLDQDFVDGVVTLLTVDSADVERKALHMVRTYGIRALDALHIGAAQLLLPELVGPGDIAVFVSRDNQRADAAREVGLTVE